MTKRTFFKSIMGAVACVALAPEIAFGVRLKTPVWSPPEPTGFKLERIWVATDYMGEVEWHSIDTSD